ncbi:cell surface protein SprA [Mesonia sp. K4-1]|uniref:T9SS outer membrane translocon Sov/SprA n=1 Tax=Mesonia sp. K4-1 TaxID=2602760 RepID=UPI0011C7A243|nr:cell surface protein SprA [Mesonia sp. K4-1]
MKNIYYFTKGYKSNYILIFFLLSCTFLYSQEENETSQDSTKTGYSTGNIQLANPSSIEQKYTYDPILDRYIYTEKIGRVNVEYPMVLTPEEYRDLILQEQMKDYFKQKSDAVAGRSENAEEEQRNLLPIFYVNNSFFETIFGGSEIEVIPQGSVEVDLGVLYTKQDNPALSPRNRSNFTFDFNQRISLSLLGKVGKRLDVSFNYDTESTFDFQNQIKLDYTPDEDDIVRKIEVGNVSMPLNSSLMQGAQSLFGVKTQLQFGKTTVTGVFSEQNSERQTTNIQGGGAVQEFEKFILDYDENRHFFLAHYFRDQYNQSLQNYPFINSNIQVTRLQIWVTNRTNSTQALTNARNIVAIQDLGESNPDNVGVLLDQNGNPVTPPGFASFLNSTPGAYPSNSNNDFNPLGITGPQQSVLTPAIRDISTVDQGFGSNSTSVDEGVDYAKLENARQLDPNEYTLNTQLGYVSLNQRINNDEILAVAFQYTVNGQVYQVGEFANDGVQATQSGTNPNANPSDPNDPNNQNSIAINQNLVVKLLKSPITNVNEPIWDLMMKNIYSLDAFQLEKEDFRFNILYTDPQPLNYISQAPNSSTPLPQDVEDKNLLQVFNLDNLNLNNDPVVDGDGFFDYVPGLTIDPQNGRIIFTSVEPFGEYLFDKLDTTPNGGPEDYDNPSTYNGNQTKYVFGSLYNTTKTQAEQEQADKNKFQLKGSYKSSGQDGIPIGAFNVPQGSVTVTAGGRVLQEGVDYTVDYQLGRVKILDEALLASDTPIQVSTENNALFGQQTKRFTGIDIQHQFNENFLIGGTYLNLNERPLTQKANYSYEPINNSMYGFNINYSTEVPFFTRLVNKLPNIDTDVESNFSVRGEFAYLKPGAPKGNDFNGVATSYVDDFEASQTSISIMTPLSWSLSSAPIGFGGERANNDLASAYKRAKLNWYSIDPIFYTNQRPSGISDEDLSTYATRRVFIDEIFPNTDIIQGQAQAIYTLDLNFDPDSRGQYNFNPAAAGSNQLPNPTDNFGGIMREITTTNFEQSNVEFIEFWVMDPFIYEENNTINEGKITFNLGSISEDVLKDGRKQYENGLPDDGNVGNTLETSFGRVPSSQSLVYAFDTEGQQRTNQDLGLDGLDDLAEAQKFSGFGGLEDPANDNYEYYLSADGDILSRYKNYNGTQGNSPTEVGQNNRGNTTIPSVEDVNRDNTMNTIDSYFEYEVPVFRDMGVNNNTSSVAGIDNDYITDVKTLRTTLQNGSEMDVRWVQFKIPLRTESEYSVNGIADLRSVRFMRMFLSGFSDDVVLRFGTLDLVRGDYRRYNQALIPNGTDPENTPSTTLEVAAVSEEQTSDYVTPPGVVREELVNNNQTIREDEQSLSLTVKNLAPQDSRGVYKNFQVDMRQYKNLEMFLHAESLPFPSPTLMDGELTAFIRMGTDFSDNFYQIEIPLTVSDENSTQPRAVWPVENDLNLPMELLQQIKSLVIGNSAYNSIDLNFFTPDLAPSNSSNAGELRVGIKGNPSFGNIRVLMLGLKNTGATDASGQVWFNELRLSDLKNEGGWAAVLNMDTNFADFATVSATGRRSTVGFGTIEQGPNQRSREDVKQYDVVSTINVGQLLPKDWGINIPFSYSRGEELITPQYDPEYLDLELETLLDNTADEDRKDELQERAEDYTKRQSVSVIGLRKDRTNQDRKPMPYDVENFSFSGTYNQEDHRDFEIKDALDQNVNVGATYDYAFAPLKLEPFKNIKFLDSSEYYRPIKDFNINPLPSNISASSNIIRQYNEQQYREINLPPGSIGLPTLYQRNYTFDWQYTVNHNLTESLRFNFNSSNNRIVRNYINQDNVQDNSIGVWDGFFEIGNPNQHYQSFQLNYDLPLDKIPFLKFIRAQYSYTGNFQWQKGSEILNDLPGIPNIGHTIQNSNTHQINGTFEMNTLYKYLGLVKKRPARASSRGPQFGAQEKRSSSANKLGFSRNQTADDASNASEDTSLSAGDKALNTGIGIITSLKRLTLNYQETNGIYLPGYTNDVGFAGTLKPTAGFTFGSQADIREKAAASGWLTSYQEFNEQYTENESKNLSIQANIDLIPDLTLDLNANRLYSETYTENYRVNQQDLQYRSLTPNTFGNFNISTIMINSAFSKSDNQQSVAFEKFRENRLEIANRLATSAGIDLTDPNNINQETGYPKGFGRNSQAVLLPAFLSAYTTSNAEDVSLGVFRDTPLPNWNLKYTGLMRLGWFKDKFKRFSVQHGYTSIYNVNQFQSNLDFDRANPYGENNVDQSGNYKNPFLISNINLVEQFSPLVKVDMELKNSVKILAEIKKDRQLSLSFDNNLLTEIQGNEYILGLGYRLRDLRLATRIAGEQRIIRSDLIFKADLSYRRNETIIRYLEFDNSQTTSGQDIWGFNFNVEYSLSKNLTAIFYYDHSFSEYAVSTAFPQTTIRSGFTLRYNFGN